MAHPNFINHDGSLSDDGRKLETWLSANLQAMENASADELNAYPGTLKYLFVNRHTTTPASFVEEFPKTYALSAWQIMEAIEDREQQAQAQEQQATQTSDLVKQLEALEAKFTAQAEELAALKEAQATPEPKKTNKKSKTELADDVPETDDESAE